LSNLLQYSRANLGIKERTVVLRALLRSRAQAQILPVRRHQFIKPPKSIVLNSGVCLTQRSGDFLLGAITPELLHGFVSPSILGLFAGSFHRGDLSD
jgi:hypothetical protein